ncbi:MAG TPA: histidine triad nucleotide-binding protein [Anaerolineaceae bacterium]|jgi:histidine triad (HIT) family protein|nr:histidine triad nucleotide-binding protein [Anaerolineaceae bacterium]
MTCIFCQIAAGQAPATRYYQDDLVTAFQDTHPIAPVHILIIPNRHIESVNAITPVDEALLGHLITVAQKLAVEQGIHQSGYRLMMNTGHDGGQSIDHLHLHLLGGRHLPLRFF